MITRKLALSAGHSNETGKDNGASYNNRIEGIETVKLRNALVEEFKLHHVTVNVDDDKNVTKETVALFSKYFEEQDILIDLHFNAAADVKATGVEVIIPEKYSTMEYSMGSDICRTISNTLNISNRGVKPESMSARGKLAWMHMIGETILIEVCFISNIKDMAKYDANFTLLVKELVSMILNYKSLQIL
jgi:N-acetylmuramoyl-L-alanine amidase